MLLSSYSDSILDILGGREESPVSFWEFPSSGVWADSGVSRNSLMFLLDLKGRP